MRALTFEGSKVPLALRDMPEPAPDDHEVVLKVECVGICGSDLHMKQYDRVKPGTVLGHEFSGTISKLGKAVGGDWTVGDRVAVLPYESCGECAPCRSNLPALCKTLSFTGASRPGAYADFTKAPGRLLKRLPANVSFRQGALVEPLSVAHHAVDRAGVTEGNKVLIIGAGPIGAGIALFCRQRGAAQVIVSEPSAERRALAVELGASATIDPIGQDVAASFQSIAGSEPDIVFECVGNPGMIQEAIHQVAAGGLVMVVGVCMKEDAIVPLTALMKEITIRFSQCYDLTDFDKVIDHIAAGRIDVDPMVTKAVSLADLPDAFDEMVRRPSGCKLMVDMAI